MRRHLLFAAASFLCIATALSGERSLRPIKAGSSISYIVTHPLHEMEAVSDAVRYRLLCDSTGSRITRVSASVDVTSFDSGNSNRDSHAMEVIDALTYPDAGFTSTAVSEQGDSLQVTGLLSFHGVSKILVIPGRVDTTADRMTVHAQFSISMTEFKIDRPSLLMIPVADSIRFTLTAVFQRKD